MSSTVVKTDYSRHLVLLNDSIPMVKFGACIFLIFVLTTGCRQPILLTTQTGIDTKLPEPRKPILVPTDSIYYFHAGLNEPRLVFQYYAKRQYCEVWGKDSRHPALTDSMISLLNSVRLYGLRQQEYHLSEIKAIKLDTSDTNISGRLDILLTDAYFTMANQLKYGRLRPAPLAFSNDSSCIALLDQTHFDGDFKVLFTREPDLLGYRRLKSGLRQMLNTASADQQELLLSGLTVDSLELQKSIQCVEINLERWRLEKELPERYLWINIPAFQLYVVDDDSVAFQSKVIVGTSKRQTPLLTSVIECFVIYPYWHVPRRIAVEELLPMIKRDTNYLRLADFDVLDKKGNVLDPKDILWAGFSRDYFPVSLRQREGSENSLGVIKFVFDNPYSVYLHDTNSKRLFSNAKRALSHGCIRIEKAIPLAKYLMRSKANGVEEIDNYLRLKQKHVMNIPEPIPIYTRYFTCDYVDGQLQFYADVYNEDVKLVNAFYRAPAIPL